MAKKKNNIKVVKVDKQTAKMRMLGCLICLFALITTFFIGFFIGRLTNKNNDVKASTNVTLTSLYVLDGGYTFKNTIDMTSLVPINNGYNSWEMWFDCDTNGDGVLESYSELWAEANYNQTEKYLGYSGSNGFQLYVWDKWGDSFYSTNVISARTIFIDNYETDNSSFYNWFISNTTVYAPPVTTYDITYNFNNVISNGVDLPTTVDDDTTYTLLFNTNGVDGYFPLSEYLDVYITNCNYTIGYGNYGNVTDTGYIANLAITITDIVGDVNITFSGTSILKNSTVLYFTGSIYDIGVQFTNMENCDVYFNNNNVIIYPINLNSNYKFTVDILSYVETINKPLINIINGSSYVIYDNFNLMSDNEYDNYLCDFIIRSNSIGSVVQIKITSFNSEFDSISTSFVDWLVTAVGGFFDFSIMPGLSLGLILGSIIVIAFVVWIIRVFMGG